MGFLKLSNRSSTRIQTIAPSFIALIFSKSFILHHNFQSSELGLNTIVQRMNFKDTNTSNLIHTIEENSLEQLRRNGLILAYEKKEGLSGLKYIITLPEKTNHNREGIDGP